MSKKNVIVGLGITGEALLDYFVHLGQACIAIEGVSKEVFGKVKAKYAGKPVEFYFGDVPAPVFEQAEKFFISPGVPPTQPWVALAKKKNIPVTGEMEFASQKILGKLMAVTGTNGKSTTVSLIQTILDEEGYASSLKGNIGTPLITAVSEPPKDYYVLEVSSFQLETIETFKPKVAVILNVTSDHLERYESMQAYADAKALVTKNQTADDFFIYNADDPSCVRMETRAKKLPFSLVNQFLEGAFVDKNAMVVRWKGREHRYELSDMPISGLHNQENMLAAILSLTVLDIPSRVILSGLKKYKALPHRLEKVGCFKGISFYDDSKATNVGSVVMSLASFDKNVVLILGGRDKGGEYNPLYAMVKHKVKALIIYGEAREKIAEAFSFFENKKVVSTMPEVVSEAYRVAQAGDTVLFSPACSSFDLYKNYAQRGNHFQELVRGMRDGCSSLTA